MPSPNNVTELVIFAVGTAIVLIILFIVKKFVIKDKGDSKWMPGQPYDIKSANPQQVAARPRQKYVDPLAKLNPLYVAVSVGGLMVVVFLYYFITKGGITPGN
jgi:hypothetical protein